MMEMIVGKRVKAVTYYPYIPHEILFFGILNRLPVKSLLRFSCVNKLWHATIGDPAFIESHLIHAKEKSSSTIVGLFQIYMDSKRRRCDYLFVRKEGPYFHFHTKKWTCRVGNCNGLFCIRSRSGIEICNPSTREFLYRPLPPPPPGCLTCYGFGFVPLRNEYKVVQIVLGKGSFHRCMVYTMGMNNSSWRDITVASKLSNCLNVDALRGRNSIGGIVNPDRGLYSNRALHWFFRRAFKTLCFDLHYETFSLITGPYPSSPVKYCRCFLIEWQNCVCLAFHNIQKCDVHLYKYIKWPHKFGFKRGYWDRTVVILPYKPPSTIGFLGGESLLYWSSGEGRLGLYSPEKYENDDICPTGSETSQIFPLPLSLNSSLLECEYENHIENLLSLKALVPSQDRPSQMRYSKDKQLAQVKSVSSL